MRIRCNRFTSTMDNFDLLRRKIYNSCQQEIGEISRRGINDKINFNIAYGTTNVKPFCM